MTKFIIIIVTKSIIARIENIKTSLDLPSESDFILDLVVISFSSDSSIFAFCRDLYIS